MKVKTFVGGTVGELTHDVNSFLETVPEELVADIKLSEGEENFTAMVIYRDGCDQSRDLVTDDDKMDRRRRLRPPGAINPAFRR